MNFDDYWAIFWVPSGMPQAFDLAMKEIAEKAWNAALNEATVAVMNEHVGESIADDSLEEPDFAYNTALIHANQVIYKLVSGS